MWGSNGHLYPRRAQALWWGDENLSPGVTRVGGTREDIKCLQLAGTHRLHPAAEGGCYRLPRQWASRSQNIQCISPQTGHYGIRAGWTGSEGVSTASTRSLV